MSAWSWRRAVRAGIALVGVCALWSSAIAQSGNVPGPLPRNFGFDQKLGVKLPLDTPFLNEDGKTVRFGDCFKKRPVLFAMVFYHCNGSCLLVRDGIIKTLNAQKELLPGQDFDVVILSIHPKETPALARAEKAEWLNDFKTEGTEKGWTFLTGTWENIHKITDQVGFQYTFDEKTDRVAHAAGIVILTPDGHASEYLLGVTYPQKEVKDAILRAQDNIIGPKTEQVLWGCLQYDPKTGKTRLVVERALQVVGTLTAVLLAFSVVAMSMKYRNKPISREELAQANAAGDARDSSATEK